jgi:signal peptidase II
MTNKDAVKVRAFSFLPLILATVSVLIDQVTKIYARSYFAPDRIQIRPAIEVIPNFFELVYVENKGAAWGMLSEHTDILSIISGVMLVLIVVFRKQIFHDVLPQRIAFGLLVGGIIGNLIDRVWFGFVTDFLDFYIGTSHWPAFNVADSSICIGVVLYSISSWIVQRAEDQQAKAKAEATEVPAEKSS